MLRQHSHPPVAAAASILSPTTTAAKAGIKLNDPALRNVAASNFDAAAPNNNAAGGASNHTAVVHANNNTAGLANINSLNAGNGSSTVTTGRRKLAPFTLTSGTTSIDKENSTNSKLSHDNKDSKPAAVTVAAAKDTGSLMDELDNFCDSESLSYQQRDAQIMMDNHELESMLEDPESIRGFRMPNDDNNENQVSTGYNLELPEDCIDSDASECSGDTVVAIEIEKPPAGATQEELNQYYWEICYGPGYVPPPTVLKSVPTKSW